MTPHVTNQGRCILSQRHHAFFAGQILDVIEKGIVPVGRLRRTREDGWVRLPAMKRARYGSSSRK